MQPDARKFLEDVIEACDAVTEFVRGRSQADYRSDKLLRAGVERELMIVGEALLRARSLGAPVEDHITEVRKAIGLRHVLVHGYSAVDDDVIWGIAVGKVPLLRAEARQLLDEA